jgi:hypothetical protein
MNIAIVVHFLPRSWRADVYSHRQRVTVRLDS